MRLHGYTIRNTEELSEAKKFWLQHPEMTKGSKGSRAPRRVVRMEVTLNTGQTLEDIFQPWVLETFDMDPSQRSRQTLDVGGCDNAIFCVENKERVAELEATLDALTDEDLETLTSTQVN